MQNKSLRHLCPLNRNRVPRSTKKCKLIQGSSPQHKNKTNKYNWDYNDNRCRDAACMMMTTNMGILGIAVVAFSI